MNSSNPSRTDIDNAIKKASILLASYLSEQYQILVSYITINFQSQTPAKLLTYINKKFSIIEKTLKKKSDKYFDDVFKTILKAEYMDLSKSQIAQISQYKSLLLDEMKVPTNRLKREFKKALILNQTGNKTQADLLRALKLYAPKAFKRHIKTVFNTHLQRTFKKSMWDSIKGKYDYYLYSGVRDSKNRDYPCRQYANRVITSRKAQSLISVMMNLYNCRHKIIPFIGTEQEAKRRLVS